MDEDTSKSVDLFGLKGISDSLKVITQGVVDAASAFLSRICLPAAEEFGLLIKDKVTKWRTKNTVTMLQKAEELLDSYPEADKKHAPPRLLTSAKVMQSWTFTECLSIKASGVWWLLH